MPRRKDKARTSIYRPLRLKVVYIPEPPRERDNISVGRLVAWADGTPRKHALLEVAE